MARSHARGCRVHGGGRPLLGVEYGWKVGNVGTAGTDNACSSASGSARASRYAARPVRGRTLGRPGRRVMSRVGASALRAAGSVATTRGTSTDSEATASSTAASRSTARGSDASTAGSTYWRRTNLATAPLRCTTSIACTAELDALGSGRTVRTRALGPTARAAHARTSTLGECAVNGWVWAPRLARRGGRTTRAQRPSARAVRARGLPRSPSTRRDSSPRQCR
jgi:hypothetical protein